jgi:hypothetical protein
MQTLAPAAAPGTEEGQLTLAADIQPTLDGARATVRIASYAPAPGCLPEGGIAGDGDPAEWIDVWAVDWDYDGAVFRVGSHAARGRRGSAPPLALSHSYERRGTYTVAVRITDLLCGETTRTLRVELPG